MDEVGVCWLFKGLDFHPDPGKWRHATERISSIHVESEVKGFWNFCVLHKYNCAWSSMPGLIM